MNTNALSHTHTGDPLSASRGISAEYFDFLQRPNTNTNTNTHTHTNTNTNTNINTNTNTNTNSNINTNTSLPTLTPSLSLSVGDVVGGDVPPSDWQKFYESFRNLEDEGYVC